MEADLERVGHFLTCEKCTLQFSNETLLSLHMKFAHATRVKEEEIEGEANNEEIEHFQDIPLDTEVIDLCDDENEEKTMFTCKFCDKEFSINFQLKRHIAKKHKLKRGITSSLAESTNPQSNNVHSKVKCKCGQCDKKMCTKSSLINPENSFSGLQVQVVVNLDGSSTLVHNSLISKETPNCHQCGSSPMCSQDGQDYPPVSSAASPLQLTPTLDDSQIQRIINAAEVVIKGMSDTVVEATQSTNKKVCKEIEMVLAMSNDDPRKLEEIRRYSAIYGRFNGKRKPEKPFNLHEVSVNEAAAQLCLREPILLMRRDELFHLSRQVVRDSGYQYRKGRSRSRFQKTGYYSKIFGLSGGDSSKIEDEEDSRDSTNDIHPMKRGFYDFEDGHQVQTKTKEIMIENVRTLSSSKSEIILFDNTEDILLDD